MPTPRRRIQSRAGPVGSASPTPMCPGVETHAGCKIVRSGHSRCVPDRRPLRAASRTSSTPDRRVIEFTCCPRSWPRSRTSWCTSAVRSRRDHLHRAPATSRPADHIQVTRVTEEITVISDGPRRSSRNLASSTFAEGAGPRELEKNKRLGQAARRVRASRSPLARASPWIRTARPAGSGWAAAKLRQRRAAAKRRQLRKKREGERAAATLGVQPGSVIPAGCAC